MWVDREGRAVAVDTSWHLTSSTGAFALSPDGRAIALSLSSPTEVGSDIWIKRLDSGTLSRLTFDRTFNDRPVWTPDGRSVAFVSSDTQAWNGGEIWMKRADGTGSEELVASSPGGLSGLCFSRDGKWLLVQSPSRGPNGADIGARRLGIPDSIHWILGTHFHERFPTLSPDGRWLAYVASETNDPGGGEVYVRPFPEVSAGKWQVSTGGGFFPLWSTSGRNLFFTSGGNLAEVDIGQGPQFSASRQRTLFSVAPFLINGGVSYAMTPNNPRFLMYGSTSGRQELILTQDWEQSLGRR